MPKKLRRIFVQKPKEFGKNYFSLISILAYAVAPKLHAHHVKYMSAHESFYSMGEEEDDDDPPPLEEIFENTFSFIQNHKACHCNCYFRTRAILFLKLAQLINQCNCKCRFFSFRRSGTHPPRLSFF